MSGRGKVEGLTARTAVGGVAGLLLVVSIACGNSPSDEDPLPQAPLLPTDVLSPPMRPTDQALAAGDIAAPALVPDELEALLNDVGLQSAAQRSFQGGRGAYSRVVARGLVFASEAGATTYLDWLRDHIEELIGDAEHMSAEGLPEGALFVRHLPGGCCPKETPVYLVAWQRGTFVLSVEAGGPRARRAPIVPIVRAFDEEI
jgi:hypothetical protein